MMIVLGLSSCSQPNAEDRLKSVKTIFPHSQIYSRDNSQTAFIIMDSTGLKLIYVNNFFNANITSVEILLQR